MIGDSWSSKRWKSPLGVGSVTTIAVPRASARERRPTAGASASWSASVAWSSVNAL